MRQKKSAQKCLFSKLRKHLGKACVMSFLSLKILVPDVLAGESQHFRFQCPQAYQGIKSDMLPTYWEATDQGKRIHARQSLVQGEYMICIYRKATGKPIGNVRRLIPKGYRCITGGRGAFQCSQSMNQRNGR